ncbi:MAG: Fe-S cluster assembly protein SufD [Cyanobacteriota bacterium]|nr:Fe-S cluster assembly protein SufD [Cyanobacteriota bacterium]
MPTLSPLPSRQSALAGTSWIQALLQAHPASLATLEAPQLRERLAARLALESTSLPGKREEAWRFTDLSLLTQIPPRPLEPAVGNTKSQAWPAPHSWRLSLNAWPEAGETTWPEGIEPLHGPELEAQLGRVLAATETADHWSVLLNSAIAQPVVALRIGPGVRTCLEVVSDSEQRAGVQAHRLLLVLEEGACLDLLQVHQADGPSLCSVVVEAQLGPNSTLRHGQVSHGSNHGVLLAMTAVNQAPGSSYTLTSVGSGWGLARQEPVILQSEGQATSQLRGLHWVNDHQISDTHSRVKFTGPAGQLDQVHKVVAEAEGRSVFNGCIQVPREAQRTKAAQLSRSLLLSDRARIDTKPELEIVADDVRCTHGATISRLQQNELFYLQSRGIAAPQASRLLLRGFCEEVVCQLPSAAQGWSPLSSLLQEEARP